MDRDELVVFIRTENALRQYSANFKYDYLAPRIDKAQRYNLESHVQHLTHLEALCEKNAEVLNMFADSVGEFTETGAAASDLGSDAEPSQLDESKVLSTLRQATREWSSDGAEERAQSVGRVVEALCRYYPSDVRPSTKVVVPGSGLGRLPFELSLQGFQAIGNEFSTHMLLASHSILNGTTNKEDLAIYPYIHSPSHWRTNEDQYREVRVPDTWPSGCDQLGSMSMFVGAFEEMVAADNKGAFQAIATCFFVDAPYNFVDTLKAVTDAVEVGGLWVNFGPLHWHSEDTNIAGLEFSLEDVVQLAETAGWSFLERKSDIPATYCSTHPHQRSRMVFNCNFWVARKISDNFNVSH